MGEQQIEQQKGGEEIRVFVRKLLRDVHALEWMFEHGKMESGVRRIGAEQELFLVDRVWRPSPAGLPILERGQEPHWTTELGQFNLEINLDPQEFTGDCLGRMERQLQEELARLRKVAHEYGVEAVLVGILPTLRMSDMDLQNMTPRPRYHALNDILNQMRGGAFEFRLKGIDEVSIRLQSVMLEACCTSFQVHLQVDPDHFVRLYNLAQAITAPLLASVANSPLLFGRRLWRETRIPLFQQSLDTRTTSSHLRERFPRVSLGTRWIRHTPVEIFAEDIARFRVLLAVPVEEDPFAALRANRSPDLRALRLFNGTVYRWNRACYGLTDGKPHLRIENRVIPAGPTILDEMANGAFFLGLMNGMPEQCPDVTAVMEFSHAESNFLAAAQHGLGARELVLRELLPVARAGLASAGVVPEDIDRYLGVIEERVASGQTGAQWQLDSFDSLRSQDQPDVVLRSLTASMSHQQWHGEPVHRWHPVTLSELGKGDRDMRIEEFMTTDLLTVHPEEPVDLVLHLMDWKRIRHVPVENEQGQLVGMVSWYHLVRVLRSREALGEPKSVREIMQTELSTVTPETLLDAALRVMKQAGADSLPVVKDGHLVGIVTERDIIRIAYRFMGADETPHRNFGATPEVSPKDGE
jgi:CBS domain-containing protein